MMTAVGYIRVSSEHQVEEGFSLTTQSERLNAWATTKGTSLEKIVSDEGFSGGTMDRPGLDSILDDLDSIDTLVVVQLDRLTRSVRDLGHLLEVFQQHDVSLVSLSEIVDATSASGRLVLNILMSVSEWQREDVSEKTTAVLRGKQERGEHVGRIPYGCALDSSGCLVQDPEQVAAIKVMKRMRRRGKSLREIGTKYGLAPATVMKLTSTDLRKLVPSNV